MASDGVRDPVEDYVHELKGAVATEDPNILREVISRHSESRLRDRVLADALAISCYRGHHEAARYLLTEENANADSTSKNVPECKDTPPLVLAVKHCEAPFRRESPPNTTTDHLSPSRALGPIGPDQSPDQLRTISLLLKHDATLSGRDTDGKSALSHVLRPNVAELLLAQQGDDELRKALIERRDGQGNDALMCAILDQFCSDAVAMLYIGHGGDKRTVDGQRRTTLMNAAWRQRSQLVELLLEDKSIAGAIDDKKRNIWHHITIDKDRKQSDDTSKLLFAMEEADATINAVDNQGHTPLHMSAYFGTLAIAEGLLEKRNVDLEAIETHEKKTALHFAAANGDANFVQALLQKGANRVASCKGGLLPLHLVCGRVKDADTAAELLLGQDAQEQLGSRTEENMTPLHIAAAHGNEAIVNLILRSSNAIDIDARCEGGWTALHLACGRHMSISKDPTRSNNASTQQLSAPEEATDAAPRYLAVVQALLSAGAKVNARSRLSRTALHIAAEMGHVEIVELLLRQEDVQFAAKDSRGNTPLIDAAKSKERKQILELLAPWNKLFVQSLPQYVTQAAAEYDANVIDFQKAAGSKMLRHKIPVSDMLFKECGEAGALSHSHVSTKPDPEKADAFRWIHLPFNNLHWAHSLLTKHFIECSVDVESFKALERSLSQQQYRGRRIHSRFMRPACTKLIRRFGDHGHTHHSSALDGTDDSHIPDLRERGRINSTEVAGDTTAPPSPKAYTYTADRDFSGLRLQLEPQVIEDPQTHEKTTKPLRLNIKAPIGQMSAVMESGQASVAFPERKASPTAAKSSGSQDFGACLFMPYLTLENKENVKTMHSHLRDALRPSIGDATTKPNDSHTSATSLPGRDAQLHRAYDQWTTNDYCLHVRRTLDQFWYRNVDTGVRDGDQVVQRHQEKERKPASSIDSLMVDQLWIWVLGPSLIVTSFPQDWQHPRAEMPDLLSSILEEIDPRNGTPTQSVYELAACIVGHCLSSCDQATDTTSQQSRSSVLEMFGSSVGDVMNQEVILFSRFKEASVIASKWVRASSNTKEDPEEVQRKLEQEYLDKMATEDDRRPTVSGEPRFVEDLLNIHTETKLLEEVKDIQDELGILLQVVDDQHGVHKDIRNTFGPLLSQDSGPYQARSSGILDEQCMFLDQQRVEIKNMLKQVKSTYKSITNLLDLKQKQANVFEARAARKLAVETARAGGTLMVFTVVTVIFLPLSFLAAFFAIVFEGLPYNAQDRLPLSFILKYVVGVGLGTAVAFVFMAWHHHKAMRWLHNALRRIKGSAVLPRIIVKNVARWIWLIIVLSNIFGWRKRNIEQLRPPDNHSSSNVHIFDRTKVSPASSSTVREKRANLLHDDVEKGGNM